MEALYKKYSGPFANAVDAVGCQLITAVPLPGWLLSGQIQSLLPDSDAFQKAAREQPLSLAPGLTDVLKSGKPPSLDFFKSLPGCTKRHQWGIYVLVLERPGSKAKIYIGSGTHAVDRLKARCRGYKSGTGPWSKHTRTAMKDGYRLSSFGLLCWIDLPSPTQELRQRARMLVLESVMAINFNACRETIVDKLYIEDFYLWDRADTDWEPLFGHLSITEKVARNGRLSDAELLAAAASRKERNRAKSQRYRKRKRKREEDEVEYLERNLAQHQAWSAANPGRVNQIAQATKQRAKDSGRFVCGPCNNKAFASDFSLKEHYNTKKHKRAVADSQPTQTDIT